MDYEKGLSDGRYAITFTDLQQANQKEITRGIHIYDETSKTGKFVMFIKSFLLKIGYLKEVNVGDQDAPELIVVNRRSLDNWRSSVKAIISKETFEAIDKVNLGSTMNLGSMVAAVKSHLDSSKPKQAGSQTSPSSSPSDQGLKASEPNPEPPVVLSSPEGSQPLSESTGFERSLESVVTASPEFKNYGIQCNHQGLVLTGVSIRPANLFFEKLFEGTSYKTTMPGSGELFRFTGPANQSVKQIHKDIRKYCKQKATECPNEVVSFCAQGTSGQFKIDTEAPTDIPDLANIYGTNSYQITRKEIQDTLDSQRIYTSSLLPLPFYKGLKAAMEAANIVVLPGHEGALKLLSECGSQYPAIGGFLKKVQANPTEYGFKKDLKDSFSFDDMLKMTIYQIGSMVVKSEDYRIFMDVNGKILERAPNQKDAICLINACGIRGVSCKKTPKDFNKRIMTETFKVSLKAAGEGVVIFPAVGMGVWRGDPDLYWRAFLDAVIASDIPLTKIYVNPRHQKTVVGTKYKGSAGEEFNTILEEYKRKSNGQTFAKLKKISNLYSKPKDVLQLAHSIKKAFPDQKVSVFNASDPDVTLGNHVGEYTNYWPHTTTTEENYTAMGTNGLCFEGITGIHEAGNEGRLIQG